MVDCSCVEASAAAPSDNDGESQQPALAGLADRLVRAWRDRSFSLLAYSRIADWHHGLNVNTKIARAERWRWRWHMGIVHRHIFRLISRGRERSDALIQDWLLGTLL